MFHKCFILKCNHDLAPINTLQLLYIKTNTTADCDAWLTDADVGRRGVYDGLMLLVQKLSLAESKSRRSPCTRTLTSCSASYTALNSSDLIYRRRCESLHRTRYYESLGARNGVAVNRRARRERRLVWLRWRIIQ